LSAETAKSRGYFAVGAEGISKPMNLGAILRTAHAFGASFAFTVRANHGVFERDLSDTSKSSIHVPLYHYGSIAEFRLPENCTLVGVELCDDAVDLPSFRHPRNAAYVLGPEEGNLSQGLQDQCSFIVKIPTRFCVNVALAAAIIMYDRTLSLGDWSPRPIMPGGPNPGDPKTWPRRVPNAKLPKT
jgi:tRNA G18 (ribose-2'-O)-methylase SpoU